MWVTIVKHRTCHRTGQQLKGCSRSASKDPQPSARAIWSTRVPTLSFGAKLCHCLPHIEMRRTSSKKAGPVQGEFLAAFDAGALAGHRIGVYRLVEEVGRGGMGTVYRAVRDDDEFQMVVAIKIVSRGMDTDMVLRRFRTERQILASLDHAHIARILDGGSTASGLPYFVMEYVDGLPLDGILRQAPAHRHRAASVISEGLRCRGIRASQLRYSSRSEARKHFSYERRHPEATRFRYRQDRQRRRRRSHGDWSGYGDSRVRRAPSRFAAEPSDRPVTSILSA